MANNSLPEKFLSIDVECVATSPRHDARAVSLVAVVDQNERVLLQKKVKPTKPVFNYLTPLTGLRQGDLDDGENLESVIAEVKALLGPDVVLVGQGVINDVEWLSLQEGVDYERRIELGELFKAYNHKYGNMNYFSLSHEANTLLGAGNIREPHKPVTDAIASLRLFRKYYPNPRLLEEAKQKLLQNRPAPSFAKRNNHQWEGVCMATYMPSRCFCGAPTRN